MDSRLPSFFCSPQLGLLNRLHKTARALQHECGERSPVYDGSR